MHEELSERLKKVVDDLEHTSKTYMSLEHRVKKLEYDSERLETQNYTILTQQGAVRVAMMNIKDSLRAAVNSVSSGMSKLAAGFGTVEDDLQATLGYTKQEIEKMGAKEYREKILVPLGMARSWQR